MSYNDTSVTGIIANEPELKFSQSGVMYLALSVPDKKQKKNDQGGYDDVSATTWFRATVFGEVAEMLASKVSKLDEVTVTGRLVTREYPKDDGSTGSSLEVDNARVAWHGPKRDRQQSQQSAGAWGQPQQAAQPAAAGNWGGNPSIDEPPF